MIKLVICDDDRGFCELEKTSINRIMKEQFSQLPFTIDVYYDGDSLLDGYPQEKQDVLFLDIELGQQNGFDVAGAVSKINRQANIVFITTHNNLVYDSFEYRPVGFVEKMHFDEEFGRVMHRVIRNLVAMHRVIEFGELKNKKQFMIDEIHMVQAYGHDIIVSCENGNVQLRDKFGSHTDELYENGFLLVSRGIMVNRKQIRSIENRQLHLYDGAVVAIGRSHYREVKAQFEHDQISQAIGQY